MLRIADLEQYMFSAKNMEASFIKEEEKIVLLPEKNDFVKNNHDGIRLIRIPYTLEFSDIRSPLLKAIKETPKNQIKYIGDYPKRETPKTPKSKFKINESKLSLIDTIKNI